jgi:hypothetical protein
MMLRPIKLHHHVYVTAKDSQIYTNQVYVNYIKEYQGRPKMEDGRGLRVLDLFCGVGSGTLVLKKMKIPLETIVHVEHDPVAVFVNKYNHMKYNIGGSNDGDGIQHVYISRYEDFVIQLEDLINRYGPFDLLLAAAPCRNFCKLLSTLLWKCTATVRCIFLTVTYSIYSQSQWIQKEKPKDGKNRLPFRRW